MKKVFLSVLCAIFCSLYAFFSTASITPSRPFPHAKNVTPITATAQTPTQPTANSYACILTDNVFFYSAPNEYSGVFLLPKTYYVKLLSYQNDYCKIEYQTTDTVYQTLTGYAKTEQLTFVEYTPVCPYLSYQFDVEYRIDELPNQTSGFLTEIIFNCAYYGDYKVGSTTYCYVLREGEFGYVPKPNDFTATPNTEYDDYIATLTKPTEPEATSSATESETPSSPAQIVVLIALCLLVPILAALILKPHRPNPYERDN